MYPGDILKAQALAPQVHLNVIADRALAWVKK